MWLTRSNGLKSKGGVRSELCDDRTKGKGMCINLLLFSITGKWKLKNKD